MPSLTLAKISRFGVLVALAYGILKIFASQNDQREVVQYYIDDGTERFSGQVSISSSSRLVWANETAGRAELPNVALEEEDSGEKIVKIQATYDDEDGRNRFNVREYPELATRSRNRKWETDAHDVEIGVVGVDSVAFNATSVGPSLS